MGLNETPSAQRTHIGFFGCRMLREITLPESITAIAGDAFDFCGSLTVQAPMGSFPEAFAKEKGIPNRANMKL